VTSSKRSDSDRLPPHSLEAEASLLGAILLAGSGPEGAAGPGALLARAIERFGGSQPFYDLRHRDIFAAASALHAQGKQLDLITLGEHLRIAKQLEPVGGLAYLSTITDQAVPGTFEQHLEIVWNRFMARSGFNLVSDWAAKIFQAGAVAPEALLEIRRRVEHIEAEASRHAAQPRYLRQPVDFGDAFWAKFFGGQTGEPGLELPIEFKLKIRYAESTLVSGDDGSGKSTVLNFFLIHLLRQLERGERACLASFEMPPEVTLWILCSQLLGDKRQPDSTAGQNAVSAALAWLQPRLLFYNFLGIGDWRDVMDHFRYAAEKLGSRLFIIDSVMRIGIADDDYALQATVAAQFDQFAKDYEGHLFYVLHENKADAKGKARIRGNKLWTANACNVVRVERNVDKSERIEKAEWQLTLERRAAEPDDAAIRKHEEAVVKAQRECDTRIVLQKQRWPGSQQNASRRVWFCPHSFQFRTEHADTSVNWLERWKENKG